MAVVEASTIHPKALPGHTLPPLAASRIWRLGHFSDVTQAFPQYLDSQVAGNYGPLYPKVDHYWLIIAHNYEPLALQVVAVRACSYSG